MNQMPDAGCMRRNAPVYKDVTQGDSRYLSVEGVAKHYHLGSRTLKSLDDITLRIPKGEVLGLVGESGCGKSTLAKVITRLVPATAGTITINGEDWLAPRGEALRRQRRYLQLVFQDPFSALDPRMTIGTSMAAPLAHHDIGTPADRMQRVKAMLNEVGLDESFVDRLPRQCSGGQLQRVVIGRALLLEPRLLVCDEPTSALDASMRTQILNLLLDLKRRRGLTMLMISHDLRVVRYLSDSIAVMYLGSIVEIGKSESIFANPLHPYTQALIASSMLDEAGLDISRLLKEGDLPSPLNMPQGCRFENRCPHARPDCATVEPGLKVASPDHYVRCRYWASLSR